MDRWPHEVYYHPKDEILRHVKNKRWQMFRLLLKGLYTYEKLIRLDQWLRDEVSETPPHVVRTCVDNYINALRRGGQLNENYEVVR